MDTTVRVQTIGVRPSWIQHRVPDKVRHQLYLAWRVREDLVTLHHTYEEQVKQIWSSYPAVKATEKRLEKAEKRAERAAEVVKQQRRAQRTTRVGKPAADELRHAQTAARAARAARREAIAEVREDAQAQIREASQAQRAAQKELYRQYCTEGDLYWATFNMLLDQHRAAIKRVNKVRRQGRPAELRHRRFDGSGTIAVQLQRQKDTPARTPERIADAEAGKWRNTISIPWIDPDTYNAMTRSEQRRAGRGMVRMRCGIMDGEPVWVELPVQQHRMLPADADITGVQLSVRRTANQFRAQLAVTAKIPGTRHTPRNGPAVAIHLGYRRDPDSGGVVVAHWRATQRLTIRHSLREYIDPTHWHLTGRIILPANIAEQISYADNIQSQRNLTFNTVRDKLADWVDEHQPIPHPDGLDTLLTGEDVREWRTPGPLVALTRAWDEHPSHKPGAAAVQSMLKEWVAADTPLWCRQEDSRRKAALRRLHIYRWVAAAISGQASRIIVDDVDLGESARRAAAKSDIGREAAHRLARQRRDAAPAQLRQAIVTAANRDGVPVTVVDSTHISRTCPHCRHINDSERAVTIICAACQRSYDRDTTATAHMLLRADAAT